MQSYDLPDTLTSKPFAIELADGVGATVYLRRTLSAGDFLELHDMVERLPFATRVCAFSLRTTSRPTCRRAWANSSAIGARRVGGRCM